MIKSFWICQFSCLLVLLPFIVSPPTVAKCFPLRTFFIQGNKKKVSRGKIRWIGKVGHRVLPFFVKNHGTLGTVWAGALINRPSWNGYIKSLQKNSLKLDTTSHNNASWYTDTDGVLEHQSSGGSLYYKGPVLLGAHPPEDNSIWGQGPPPHIFLNIKGIYIAYCSTVWPSKQIY